MTLNVDWFLIHFHRIGHSISPPSDNSVITYLPRGHNIRSTGANPGEYSWTAPDAMSIEQVVITPFSPLGGGNQILTGSISFRFLVENDFGNLISRASLSYVNNAADTSPPPSDPVAPNGSTGEVWDLGLTVPKNTRMQIETHLIGTSVNPDTTVFRVTLLGNWLRDVEE